MKINQILGKNYKTNQEKGQHRSVFELIICKKLIEIYQYFDLFTWSFYATIRLSM